MMMHNQPQQRRSTKQSFAHPNTTTGPQPIDDKKNDLQGTQLRPQQ
jgi:hypothetical protein